jgi:hypothetical protein
MSLEVTGVGIMIDQHGDGYRWRLVRRTGHGADVLARGIRDYPDERGCYHATGMLPAAAGESMLVVQQPDGHWRWVVNGPDGGPLAESPAVFRDAAACGQALADVRRELAASVPAA